MSDFVAAGPKAASGIVPRWTHNPARRAGQARAGRRVVCMLCPGGTEHSGGIGRWAGYLAATWPGMVGAPPLRIIDTRGQGGVVSSVAMFGLALLRLGWLHLTGQLALVHLNLSVRGSTVRKCLVSTLAWWAGVPTVVHLHSGRFPSFYRGLPRWAEGAVRRMFERASGVVVLGDIWQEVVVADLGVPRSKVRIILNAVSGPPEPAVHAERDDCHIVMLGRLGAPKGTPELMRALASDTMRGLQWRASLAGDGDPAPFQETAGRDGITDKVAFLGWVDGPGVARLLADADILVLPSRCENLPVSVLEGLAYGVPVVTTPVGATPELVTDGVSALLVPVGDHEALAAALARLVADRELRRRIGTAGRALFEDRLDIRTCAKKVAAFYDEVLSR